MTLIAYGINHKTTPLAVRERLAFVNSDQTETALHSFIDFSSTEEVVLVATCNRTEIYAVDCDADHIQNWLMDYKQLAKDSILLNSYVYRDRDVVKHLIRVASGLDSMVVGEPQILGQIKQAYQIAQEVGTIGRTLKPLFPAAFAASKQIRSKTKISENSVTFAYSVLQMAKQTFPDLSQTKALLIGAGDTIELMGRHFQKNALKKMWIVNRTLEKASELASEIGAEPVAAHDLNAYLAEADIIISATACPIPIMGKTVIEQVMSKRQKPLFIADLAVPRDVEPEVRMVPGVHLYDLDDLQQFIANNLQTRQDAAERAELLAEEETEHYVRQLHIADAADKIRGFRRRVKSWRDEELADAVAYWQKTQDPEAAMQKLARNLANKIMHEPTLKLRRAAYHKRQELLLLIKELFHL